MHQCGPHLVHGAEDMSIILLEAADAGETCQGSRQLVPVQDAKVGHAKGQLSPGARPVIKHQTGAKQIDRRSVKNAIYNCQLQPRVIAKLKFTRMFQYYYERRSIFDLTDIQHFDKMCLQARFPFQWDPWRGLPMWIAQRLEQ